MLMPPNVVFRISVMELVNKLQKIQKLQTKYEREMLKILLSNLFSSSTVVT